MVSKSKQRLLTKISAMGIWEPTQNGVKLRILDMTQRAGSRDTIVVTFIGKDKIKAIKELRTTPTDKPVEHSLGCNRNRHLATVIFPDGHFDGEKKKFVSAGGCVKLVIDRENKSTIFFHWKNQSKSSS